MPEGDTIHRSAATLRSRLAGRRLERLELRAASGGGREPQPGEHVDDVEARGKHLLMWFGGGLILHSHMRMNGSWHVYEPGQRWQRSPRSARALVAVPGTVAVCFAAPVVELLDEPALRRHPTLRRLGPDLCAPDPPLAEIVARARRLAAPAAGLGELLLDQRVASGVGNVIKSEVCHLTGHHPATPIGGLADADLRTAFATAAELLRANLDAGPRTTVAGAPGGTVAVYGRDGRPCRTCGAGVLARRTGTPARVTYWCPTCQPTPGAQEAGP